MGSFSIFHWFVLLVILGILFLILAFVIWLIKKKPFPIFQMPDQNPLPVGAVAIEATDRQKLALRIIAGLYLFGGMFGVINLFAAISGVSLTFLVTLAWVVLFAQVGVALYGGWKLWRSEAIGAQLLFWLSLSCVPVVSCPAIQYWCAIGFGLFPLISVGAGHIGTDVSLQFGYVARLGFFGDVFGLQIGLNVIAAAVLFALNKLMKAAAIPIWPLVFPKTSQSASSV